MRTDMQRLRAPLLHLSLWITLSMVMVPNPCSAWIAGGVAISPNTTTYKPFILSDGVNGGTIVAWYGGTGSDIFAQRLRSDGSVAQGLASAGPPTGGAAT